MMDMMNGFLGDRILVNGVPQPTFEVDQGWHRIRLLNGSNARIYKLAWDRALPMTIIGSDGGLLERPLARSVLTLAPAQRMDVLVDLSALPPGMSVHLDSLAFPEADAGIVGMMGMRGGGQAVTRNGAPMRVMTLRTRARTGQAFRLPERLSTFEPGWSDSPSRATRVIPLTFMRMQWLIGGRTFAMDDVAPEETVTAGSTHIWEFRNQANPMGMQAAHPMHIHGPQFRVRSRTGGSSNALREGISDAGWQDTVLVLPGEAVQVQIRFTRHPGLYLYHCHILEHEDMGMMRNFRVAAGQ
jgi:FtsP/CotA-like multicopper oxidase with cupredoxin domain